MSPVDVRCVCLFQPDPCHPDDDDAVGGGGGGGEDDVAVGDGPGAGRMLCMPVTFEDWSISSLRRPIRNLYSAAALAVRGIVEWQASKSARIQWRRAARFAAGLVRKTRRNAR